MPRTPASNKSQYKYNAAHIKRVPLDLQKERYEEVKDHATSRGETVNGFIKRAIDETIVRDKGK